MSKDLELINFIDGCTLLVVIVSYKSGDLTVDAIDSLTSELSEMPLMRVVIVDNTCGDDANIVQTEHGAMQVAVPNNSQQEVVLGSPVQCVASIFSSRQRQPPATVALSCVFRSRLSPLQWNGREF